MSLIHTEWGHRIEIINEVMGPKGVKGKVISIWQLEGNKEIRLLTAWAEPHK